MGAVIYSRAWAPLVVVLVACSSSTSETPGPPGQGGAPIDEGGAADTSVPESGDALADNTLDAMDASVSDEDAPPSAPRADFRSGPRLRAMVYKTADGDKMWHGWYDNQLQVPCVMQAASDGKIRCLPKVYASEFSDDQCKTPVYRTGSSCNAAAFATLSSDCGGADFYKVGAKVTPAKLYIRSGTSCADTGTVPSDPIYALAPMAVSMAVGASEVHDPRGSDLMETYLEADDGALQPVSAYDPARKSDCSPVAGIADDRCTPANVAYVSSNVQFWADMGCSTSRLAARFGCANPMPVAVMMLLTSQDACGNVTPMYSYTEIGSETSAASFVGNSQACQNNTQASPYPRLFAVGAAIDPTTMPKVGLTDEGAGRLKVRYEVDGQGHKVHATTLYDSQRKEICQPTSTSDGLRCIPSSDDAPAFSDDHCTKAVAFASKPLASCPDRTPPAFVHSGGIGTCDDHISPTRYYAVGAKLDQPQLYQAVPTCTSNDNISGVDIYDTTEIQATEFAPLEDLKE